MTIYVDNMHGWARVDRGNGRVVTGRWSHLLADYPAELAGFAARLGLRPEWIQFSGTAWEHFEIVEAVRRRAVAAGAVPISYPGGTGNLVATKRLQASALDAAGRGWHVFPLRPGTKIPALRDWEHQASVDPGRIRELWTVRLQRDGWYVPEPRNVGIACGPSGLVVIDLDLARPDQDRSGWPKEWLERDITSGADVLAALSDQAGQAVPPTFVVATPSGGRHLYFTAPAGVHLRNSAGHLGPMIDIRGEGGYVVAAGSRLHPRWDDSSVEPSALTYRLVEDRPPAELPGWLTGAITADRQRDGNSSAGRSPIEGSGHQVLDGRSEGYGVAALRGEVDRVRSAPVGQRNHTLNSAAYSLGQLVAGGVLDQDRAVQALTAAAESAGLEPTEIPATIDSGLTAGARRPRAASVRQNALSETQPATASVDVTDTVDGRADDPASHSTESLGQDDDPHAVEDGHGENRLQVGGDSAEVPAAEFTIHEDDAAIAGWLFDEAFSAWRDSRTPCYPADTLKLACEHEGLPTEGQSDRRFSGRPRLSAYEPAPGEELLDRDVWDAITQAQRDDWNRRTDRPDVAPPSGARETPDGQDARNVRGRRSFEATVEPPASEMDRLREDAETVERVTELRGDWSVRVLGDAEYAMYRELCDALRRPAPHPADEDSVDDGGADLTGQVAPGMADRAEHARADRTGPDWTDDSLSMRVTAADALGEAVRTVAEARNSGDTSVPGDDVDELTDAAYSALEVWNEPLSDPSGQAEGSEAPPGGHQQIESLPDEARPAARPEQPADPHAALDQAIEHARAAVAHLEASRAATRPRSSADGPDAAVDSGRPAYWAEPEIDL